MTSKTLVDLERENTPGSIICGYTALDIEAAINNADKAKLKELVGDDLRSISGVCEVVDYSDPDNVQVWVTVWSQPWSLQAKYDRVN